MSYPFAPPRDGLIFWVTPCSLPVAPKIKANNKVVVIKNIVRAYLNCLDISHVNYLEMFLEDLPILLQPTIFLLVYFLKLPLVTTKKKVLMIFFLKKTKVLLVYFKNSDW